MGRFVHLFPLSVYRDSLGVPVEYRRQLVRRVERMEAETAARETSGSAWLGDIRGQEFLFQDPEFQPLFARIAVAVRAYIDALGMDAGRIDFYFQRAWATLSRRGERINQHAHEQSNISVAYYLQKPANSGGIQFITENHPNEFSRGIFTPSKADLGFIQQPGLLTWNLVAMEPAEDEIVIFPSKTTHATAPSDADEPRISISADITTMLRDSRGHETMMPHFSQWRSFDSLAPDA
jgi:uncharacterized protein (TIGR02466 family)